MNNRVGNQPLLGGWVKFNVPPNMVKEFLQAVTYIIIIAFGKQAVFCFYGLETY